MLTLEAHESAEARKKNLARARTLTCTHASPSSFSRAATFAASSLGATYASSGR